ncbi:MAG: dihydropteroate synthase [Prevotellaceae bacterium]|jgi:dihydropteroate synthase|nr:dihydropteroate synthase [Prevotellaceae bacterium]
MWQIGSQKLSFERPVVMGIVNVTPDSFFAQSRCTTEAAIIERVGQFAGDGVDCIDVGGCSTRPGFPVATEAEEYQRLAYALKIIRAHFPTLPLSVDTFRAGVVQQLYGQYGSFIVNDISAGEEDAAMAETVARLQLPYIAMHKRGNPQTMQHLTDYADVVEDVKTYLRQKLAELHAQGVAQVIIDPGFGFAKTVEQNYALLRSLREFAALGAPLLVGISRKSLLWKPLQSAPGEMLCATSAVNLYALLHGANIIRVHDVKEARQMVTLSCMLKGGIKSNV